MGIGVNTKVSTKTFHNADTRGAALLVAIGILAILLVISVSFFRLATMEMQTANNYANSVQAELGVDAAIAIAIEELQKDAVAHPSVTSTDHAWRSKFNGTWAVGKQFAWGTSIYGASAIPLFPNGPGNVKGIPMVDFDAIRSEIQIRSGGARDLGDITEIENLLYIPRLDTNNYVPSFIGPGGQIQPEVYLDTISGNPVYPFITTTELAAVSLPTILPVLTNSYQTDFINPFDPTLGTINAAGNYLPEQQIHFFTDVDNDGDGLNDSIWMPLAADRLFPNDGLDNDLDGFVDELDLDGEPGIFFYSENYDKNIDNVNDRKVHLTMPLSRMFMWRDLNLPNGPPGPWQSYGVQPADLVLTLSELVSDPDQGDNSDNDFNGFIDDGIDASQYFLNKDFRLAHANGGIPVTAGHFNYPAVWTLMELDIGNPNIEIRILGEPASTIIGRQAILITDESSKVNVNQAGGLTYISNPIDNLDRTPLTRATGTGFTTHQYDLRALDDIGDALADRLWTARMGSSFGSSHPSFRTGSALATTEYTRSIIPLFLSFQNYAPLAYDISFPGYGFVDDDGSILWMATNGLDDDGDAYWYQNDGIDNDGNGLIDEPGEGELVGVDEGFKAYDYTGNGVAEFAMPEGMDEPGEFQRFRPYRNIAAEQNLDPSIDGNLTGANDANDNDNDSDRIFDEIGEFGDRPFRTTEQIKDVDQIGAVTFERNESFITIHSVDDNLSRNYYGGADLNSHSTRTATGIKLDINYATPNEIARTLIKNFPYVPSTPEVIDALGNTGPGTNPGLSGSVNFAQGLRQEDTTVVSSTPILQSDSLNQSGANFASLTGTFEQVSMMADAELRALQLAVTAKDFADANYSRSNLTLTVDDTWLNVALGNLGNTITYTQAGVEAVRINEIMVRPVRRVEAEADTNSIDPNDPYNPNIFSVGNPDPKDFNFTVRSTETELIDRGINYDPLDNNQRWFIQDGTITTNPTFPNDLSLQPLMGLRSAYAIYSNYIGVNRSISGVIQRAVVPNLIEFSFEASPQLPAGRYYLTVNTQFVNNNQTTEHDQLDVVNSVENAGNLTYFISTGSPSNSVLTRMLDHVQTATNLYPDYMDFAPGERLSPAAIGFDAAGISTGMAFMQSGDATEGFTVTVPEIGALHVAIMRTIPETNTSSPLAINFFDFSQEPDHEWVELVNISEDVVDVSGWRLVVEGDGGIEMTIPNDTYIAPNGNLLLGTNKFDYLKAFDAVGTVYQNNLNTLTTIGKANALYTFRANGIGLANGTVPGIPPLNVDANWFTDVTVPPMFENVNSVFEPGATDFVDNDGNGRSDGNYSGSLPSVPPGFIGTLGNEGANRDAFTRSTSEEHGLTGANKPWDRIVELEIPALDSINTPGEIGAFVLKGGVFPNYPEYDGLDNDGDSAILNSDAYDNNGNGLVNGVSENEGIDENRLRLHPTNLNPANTPAIPGAYHRELVQLNTSVQLDQFYPVDVEDAPDWKAFIEKRLFPGDNVIVTLYEGSPSGDPGTRINRESHVVDSITYNELDVINRSIDDVIEYTFADGVHNADYPSIWPPNTMGIDFYKSLERKHPLYNGDKHGVTNRSQATDGRYDDWADSSQYSLRETTVTTDNLFDFGVSFDPATDIENIFARTDTEHIQLFRHTLFGSPLRMNLSQRKMENPGFIFEDMPTTLAEGQFENADPSTVNFGGVLLPRRTPFRLTNQRNRAIVSPGDMLSMPHFDREQRLRANPTSAATNSGILLDSSALNQRIVISGDATARYMDDSVRQIVLGHSIGDENLDDLVGSPFFALDFRERDNAAPGLYTLDARESIDQQNDLSNDLDQLIANTSASDALSLSVATAKVVPLTPTASNFQWGGSVLSTIDWAPVLLYPLANDLAGTFSNYPGGPFYEQQYLFPIALGGLVPASVHTPGNAERWPFAKRAMNYASRNTTAFPDINFDRGGAATGLFIWDGNDGLENGEYDVYIGVNEDLRPLLANGSLNAIFGSAYVYEALGTDFENMLMDVNIFTDRDANGRVWESINPEPGSESDLNRVTNTNTINESFGEILDVIPDRNGFINYGAVTVENNYLAVLIRNRADSTVMNRISRIVLTPRAKTPGRININTLETQLGSDPTEYFNPLVGLPGIQLGYNEWDNIFGRGLISNQALVSNPLVLPSPPEDATRSQNSPDIHFRAQKLTTERASGTRIHADGRYYESIADLVQPTNIGTATNRLVYPTILSNLTINNSIDFIANEESRRFHELQHRFGRMVNMISTRSDVFKIQVTVQTGYVTDVNNDGLANYRDDAEFTVTSEKKASTIYER